MKSKTCYEVMGVPPSVSDTSLHRRFIELAEAYHPDIAPISAKRKHAAHETMGRTSDASCPICKRTAAFSEVTEAYSVLKDPKRRAEYDRKLKMIGKVCEACGGVGEITVNVGFRGGRKTKRCTACGGKGEV